MISYVGHPTDGRYFSVHFRLSPATISRASVAERRDSAPAFRQRSALMPRYYFHLEDGQSLLDDTGLHLRDLAAAQDEAVRASGNLLKAGRTVPCGMGNLGDCG